MLACQTYDILIIYFFMVFMIVELLTFRVEVFTMVDIFTISFVWSVTKLLCLSLKRIWRIYSSYCLQRQKYSCALWDFIARQAWRIQPSYFCPISWWFFSKWLLPYMRWHELGQWRCYFFLLVLCCTNLPFCNLVVILIVGSQWRWCLQH